MFRKSSVNTIISSIFWCIGCLAFAAMIHSWRKIDPPPITFEPPTTQTQATPGTAESPPPSPKANLYVIDAGHGGHDPGTQGFGAIEKDLTLKLSLELAAQLKKAGLRVLLTRHDDRFVSLPNRSAISNGSNTHAFISLHMNADATSNATTGVEVFYSFRKRGDHTAQLKKNLQLDNELGIRDERGFNLAEILQKKISTDLNLRDRGTKENNFFVIAQTSSPAVLIECGYLSNADESKFLRKSEVLKKMAASITAGILEFDKLTKNDPRYGIVLVNSNQQPVPISPVLNRP